MKASKQKLVSDTKNRGLSKPWVPIYDVGDDAHIVPQFAHSLGMMKGHPLRYPQVLKGSKIWRRTSLTKTFISVIPYQGKDKDGKDMLKSFVYKPRGNSKLAYGKTRFPIIPVINGYTEKGDKVRIIAILTDGENFAHNYKTYFAPEINEIVKKKDLNFDGIEIVRSPDKEDIDTQLKLFGDVISLIGDNEEIYACITYGTKPTPILESMALRYAYQLKKNVSIGCIVYGRYTFKDESDNNGIYDTTALFHMESVVNRLAELKISNPEIAIKAMLEDDKNDQ